MRLLRDEAGERRWVLIDIAAPADRAFDEFRLSDTSLGQPAPRSTNPDRQMCANLLDLLQP